MDRRRGGRSARANSISRTVKGKSEVQLRSGPPTLTLTNRRVSGKLPCVVQLFAAEASSDRRETDVRDRVTFLAAVHGLALDRVFVEPRVLRDPRYFPLDIWPSTFPPLRATRGRSFIRSYRRPQHVC